MILYMVVYRKHAAAEESQRPPEVCKSCSPQLLNFTMETLFCS